MIEQTKKLPKKYRTLRNIKVERAGEDLGRGLASIAAFVRHEYTNYEDVLAALPECPPDASRDEMMQWAIEYDRQYREIKRQAMELVEQMLDAAYGDEWR